MPARATADYCHPCFVNNESFMPRRLNPLNASWNNESFRGSALFPFTLFIASMHIPPYFSECVLRSAGRSNESTKRAAKMPRRFISQSQFFLIGFHASFTRTFVRLSPLYRNYSNYFAEAIRLRCCSSVC